MEEPALIKEEVQVLQSSLKDVKHAVEVQNIELEKQLAVIDEYKSEIEKLNPWIVKAEAETEISTVKPATIIEIKNHLESVKVIKIFEFLKVSQIGVGEGVAKHQQKKLTTKKKS